MDIDRPPDIVVVAGGEPVAAGLVAHVPSSARVVAADAGVARAQALGWEVDLAVGDFDSLDPGRVAELDALAGEVRRHPIDKDATDLELALDAAAERPGRVLVVGLEGGRPDHALANLLVAAAPKYASLDLELALDRGRAFVVRDRLTGALTAGSLVSVVPVHGAATVSIEGVRWPLARTVLEPGTTRGVSNEATGGPVDLLVHAGTVLCIIPQGVPPT